MREIRRRARVVGAFSDGKSAMMLVSARLGYVATAGWRYETLPADQSVGRDRDHRLTACSGAPWGPEQINRNPTAFL
jgi:hypothetical protein